nr:unnamed protein product [Digitaria exilis]
MAWASQLPPGYSIEWEPTSPEDREDLVPCASPSRVAPPSPLPPQVVGRRSEPSRAPLLARSLDGGPTRRGRRSSRPSSLPPQVAGQRSDPLWASLLTPLLAAGRWLELRASSPPPQVVSWSSEPSQAPLFASSCLSLPPQRVVGRSSLRSVVAKRDSVGESTRHNISHVYLLDVQIKVTSFSQIRDIQLVRAKQLAARSPAARASCAVRLWSTSSWFRHPTLPGQGTRTAGHLWEQARWAGVLRADGRDGIEYAVLEQFEHDGGGSRRACKRWI